MLHMSEAHEGRALMELACVPSRRLLPVDSADFGLPWAAGPAIAIPRLLHDAIGGYDERLGATRRSRITRSARGRSASTRCSVPARCSMRSVSSLGGGSSRRMRETPGIDILTRLYDLSDLPHLDQLMFSIMGQASAVPLQLHVMLQRFSFTEVQAGAGSDVGRAPFARPDQRDFA